MSDHCPYCTYPLAGGQCANCVMQSDEPPAVCKSCGVPFHEHLGVAGTCEQLAMYRKLYEHALSHVDRVFQRCTENPEPILPDFGTLGESKFAAVVRLAEEYKRVCAELRRMRAALHEIFMVEHTLPDGRTSHVIENRRRREIAIRALKGDE